MLQSGQDFAHFKIIRKLGEGGMGAVFLAEDQKLHRQVALKILPEEFFGDKERLERFEREARVAAQINHSNVTSIFDLGHAQEPGSDRTLAYIVMEYVPGVNLRDYLASHALEMVDILRLAEKIAAGLAAAHKLKIVHRDIKPENILINEDGEPRILDFGLAKPLDAPLQMSENDETVAAGLTQAGKIIGTVNYMSPEQAQGGLLDTRSDIFSFGILLYRMATGDAPFSGPTQMTILAKIIEGAHDPARSRNQAVDPELERILDKCLRKDPAKRYQDTQELVDDLRALRRHYDSGMTTSSISAARPAVQTAGRSTGRRFALPLIAVVVVVVALGFWVIGRGGGGGSGLGISGQDVVHAGENRLAILGFENKTNDEQLEWLASGLPEILLTDLSQYADLNLLSFDQVEDELRRSGIDPRQATRTDWVEASKRLGATSVLSGSYFRLGDKIRIDARLMDPGSGNLLFADKVVGDDAFALVDNLADVVTGKLQLNAQQTQVASVRDMVTDSQEAYRAYHLGQQKFLLGFDEEARAAYEEALAADSTFALAYMRIGMSHIFNGRMQLGEEYIRKAQRFQDKLPPREKALLDIYADAFVRREYGDLYSKMQSFVNAYPDDKEARSIYGQIIVAFSADTTRAFAEFDRVLEQDPTYPLALQFYAEQLAQFKYYDRALKHLRTMKKEFPESPIPYQQIPVYLEDQGKWDEAMQAYEEFRERFPNNPDVLDNMCRLAIRLREFDRARRYVDEIHRLRGDDVQWRRNAAFLQANLENWQGRFLRGLDHYREGLELAYAMQDTQLVVASMNVLSVYFERFEMPDSAIVYRKRSHDLAQPFEKMSYPLLVVTLDPDRADEMRPLFQQAEEAFQRHTPRDLWPLIELNRDIFEAHAARDTAKLIDEYLKVQELPANQRGDSARELGIFLARRGRYEDAMTYFDEAMGGNSPTSSAWRYLNISYWMAYCQENLGKLDEARQRYEEILKYWGEADLQLEPIQQARQHLARLTG
jgi:tetratricopeptide (TPR) repeat protein